MGSVCKISNAYLTHQQNKKINQIKIDIMFSGGPLNNDTHMHIQTIFLYAENFTSEGSRNALRYNQV